MTDTHRALALKIVHVMDHCANSCMSNEAINSIADLVSIMITDHVLENVYNAGVECGSSVISAIVHASASPETLKALTTSPLIKAWFEEHRP